MAICIFPGTFNPIHQGHLKMAEFALNKFNFDKIIFVPSYIPPHKEIDKKLAEHRFNMVKLAISENPYFEISDFEYKQNGKSYSILTVKHFIEKYSIKGKLNFIIGTDAFSKIDSWYHAEELKSLVHFIVFPRRGTNIEDSDWDYELTEMEYVDISSTEIRTTNCKSCNKVEEYIKENGLYKI